MPEISGLAAEVSALGQSNINIGAVNLTTTGTVTGGTVDGATVKFDTAQPHTAAGDMTITPGTPGVGGNLILTALSQLRVDTIKDHAGANAASVNGETQRIVASGTTGAIAAAGNTTIGPWTLAAGETPKILTWVVEDSANDSFNEGSTPLTECVTSALRRTANPLEFTAFLINFSVATSHTVRWVVIAVK